VLADLGLAAALNAQASKSALPVTVEADGIGRLGQDIEAAVYFCCLEALQNTVNTPTPPRPASACRQNGSPRFTVSDDGTATTPGTSRWAQGLRNGRPACRPRRPAVRSVPAHGTTITGHLPPSCD
jgi:hypothetical protein